MTTFGVYVDLKSIGNALGLRVNKKCDRRIAFDCYDYVYRRGKSKNSSGVSGPACKNEITVLTTANCKSTKKAMYSLRVEPGLKKLLFDESNSRIRNAADRQRLLNAQRWYRVADSLDLSSRFFHGKETYILTKQLSERDGETLFGELMQDTFIVPTNDRKSDIELKPVEPAPIETTIETTVSSTPSFALQEGNDVDFDKWLADLATTYDYDVVGDLM